MGRVGSAGRAVAGKMAARHSAGCNTPVPPQPPQGHRGTEGDAGMMEGDVRNEQLQTQGPETLRSGALLFPEIRPTARRGVPKKTRPLNQCNAAHQPRRRQRGASAAARGVSVHGAGRDSRGRPGGLAHPQQEREQGRVWHCWCWAWDSPGCGGTGSGRRVTWSEGEHQAGGAPKSDTQSSL